MSKKPKKEKYQPTEAEKTQEFIGKKTAIRGGEIADTAIKGLIGEMGKDRSQEYRNVAAADNMQRMAANKITNPAVGGGFKETAENTRRIFDASRIGNLTGIKANEDIRKNVLQLGEKQATSTSSGFNTLAKIHSSSLIKDQANQTYVRGANMAAIAKPLGAITANLIAGDNWYGGEKDT